jgi:hypothetical protein
MLLMTILWSALWLCLRLTLIGTRLNIEDIADDWAVPVAKKDDDMEFSALDEDVVHDATVILPMYVAILTNSWR